MSYLRRYWPAIILPAAGESALGSPGSAALNYQRLGPRADRWVIGDAKGWTQAWPQASRLSDPEAQ